MSGRSGAGWSEPGRSPGSATTGPDNDNLPDGTLALGGSDRYERLGRIGRGGMGDVSIALDRRLDRDVAFKRVALTFDTTEAAARLAREARITARLEHPNIVPVYDAGTDDEGRAFYTMRLIRGRSLARVLDEAHEDAGRSPLLRHYLDACHAIAYAHSQGIVHRDIKPDNIVVGGFGETQVVDWGLAAHRDAPSARANVGTAGFMSPEQARGAPPAPAADVWSLGAVLETIMPAGERAPDDLRAIAKKAKADDPKQRYSSAAELAADVERYLDGQRVSAHAYSPWELLSRAVRAWRLPLLVAGVGFLAVGAVLATSVVRVRDQRNRAVTAERRATAALSRAETTLSWALDSQAIAVLATGALPEAEVLAAHALIGGESADARGVLASAYAGARPTDVARLERPDCGRLRLSPNGLAVCVTGDQVSLWELDPLRRRWTVTAPALDAAVVAGNVAVSLATNEVAVFDGDSGRPVERLQKMGKRHGLAVSPDATLFAVSVGDIVVVVDARTRSRLATTVPCPRGFTDAIAVAGPSLIAVCRGGDLVVIDIASNDVVDRIHTPFGDRLRPALTLATDDDGRAFGIGGIGGEVAVARLEDDEALALGPVTRVTEGSIKQLAFFRGALLVVPDRGAAALWEPDSGAQLLRLPEHASEGAVVDRDALVSFGSGLWRWTVPEAPAPRLFQAPAGLAGAALSPDGGLVAAARGDGYVTIWARASGRIEANLRVADAVIKSVAFSPDGRLLAVGVADKQVKAVVFEVGSWKPSDYEAPAAGSRRIGFLADGTLIAQQYGNGFSLWTPERKRSVTSLSLGADMDTSDGDRAVLLTEAGPVFEIIPGQEPRALFEAPVGRAIATLPNRGGYAVADAGGVWLHRDGEPTFIRSPIGDVLDVAVSGDGRWMAVASKRGDIEVFELPGGSRRAVLRGHSERVSHLVFEGAQTLASASWDGSIRLWDLSPLDANASELAARAEQTWGTTLERVLGRRP